MVPARTPDYPPPPALLVPYTPEADPGTFVYTNEEGHFTLVLPGDWVVQPLGDIPLGSEYALAPELLLSFAESHVLIMDASEVSIAQAVERVCFGDDSEPEELTLASGAQVVHIPCHVAQSPLPRIEWYYAAHAGKYIFFQIRDPLTRESLTEVINTFTLLPTSWSNEMTTATPEEGT